MTSIFAYPSVRWTSVPLSGSWCVDATGRTRDGGGRDLRTSSEPNMLPVMTTLNAADSPGCIICRANEWRPRWRILKQCASCGFVTADLDGVDAQSLYTEEYFKGREYFDYLADEALFRRNFRRRLQRMLRDQPGGRLLEIGSAYGFFLDEAKAHYQTVGFEISEEPASHARAALGLDVRTTNVLETTLEDVGGPVDVVAMWDVIEHLERPDRVIAKCAELTSPGASLYLTTGDIGSGVARVRGRRWRMIHPPTHLHYFSRATITRLLELHGFRVERIDTQGVSRSLRQILYSLVALGMGRPKWYARMEPHVPAHWAIRLNLFDIMCVTARKV